MNLQELLQFGDHHSCQVFKFDDNYRQFSTASGFIFHDKEFDIRTLITVNHLFEQPFDNEKFGVFSEIGKDGTGVFSTRRLNSMYISSNDPNIYKPIDIRYRLLDERDSFLNYECDKEEPESFHSIGPCLPFTTVVSPNLADKYYFCGRVKPETVINETETERLHIEGFQRIFEEIEFLSEESDLTLRFSLPDYKELPSSIYKGCSGAAIFNKDGDLVSMLTGQTSNRDFTGINLSRILPAIISSLEIARHTKYKKSENEEEAHLLQIRMKC